MPQNFHNRFNDVTLMTASKPERPKQVIEIDASVDECISMREHEKHR